MIALAPGTRVYLACRPVSMRYGFDGLAAQVSQVVGADPFSGHLFLFRSKRADYLKCLYWDGSGMCLFAKRLESGKFVWPPIVDGQMTLTPAQLALLLEAMDWRRTVALEPRASQSRSDGAASSSDAATEWLYAPSGSGKICLCLWRSSPCRRTPTRCAGLRWICRPS